MSILKLQLFKLEGNTIGLVDLSKSQKSEIGEMDLWVVENKEIENKKITWSDLETKAVLLTWDDVPESIVKPLKGVAFKLLNEMEKENAQKVVEKDMFNYDETYKGNIRIELKKNRLKN